MEFERVLAVRTNKTIYRDGERAVKVFGDGFKESDILNEALNHARAEETGLPVPALLEVCKIEGKWAIITQFIAGKTLARRMDEEPVRREEFLERFVSLQLEVQGKRSPLMNRLHDKMYRKITEAELTDATKFELHKRLSTLPARASVCHGDFNPSNIILTDDDRAYILDWSHVTQGTGAADAARTFLLFSLENKPDLAERYLSLYCKKAGVQRADVQRWIPIVAASQSVKGRPEERELLLRWADVAEYQ